LTAGQAGPSKLIYALLKLDLYIWTSITEANNPYARILPNQFTSYDYVQFQI